MTSALVQVSEQWFCITYFPPRIEMICLKEYMAVFLMGENIWFQNIVRILIRNNVLYLQTQTSLF